MNNQVNFIVTKPSVLISLEKILLTKGFKRADLRTMQRQAVMDYMDHFIALKKIKIPSKLMLKNNAVQELLVIPESYYLKLHHCTKEMPYKLNEVAVYAIFLHYKNLLVNLQKDCRQPASGGGGRLQSEE